MSNAVLVRFLRDKTPYAKGTTAAFSEDIANAYVKNGIVELVVEEKTSGKDPINKDVNKDSINPDEKPKRVKI
jgi:hypothetical protein